MGWENDLFAWGDPLHDKLDPIDAWLQQQIVGDNQVQAQVMPELGNTAVDVVGYFFGYPGAGSLLRASNNASDGNWTGAAINGALGAFGASGWGGAAGSAGSTAGSTASTAETGLAAPEGLQGSQAVGSAGEAANTANAANTASAADSAYASQVTNNATASQPGAGWNYYDNGTAISPEGKYYFGGEQITGAGGQQMGLLDYAGKYAGNAGRFLSSPEGGKVMNAGLNGYGKITQANAAQDAKTQMMMQQARPQFAPMQDVQRGPVASFAQTSPYSPFQGGFNPQRRPVRRGLLG